MSNEVYGYLEAVEMSGKTALLAEIQAKTGIGIKQIPLSELYNFPQEILPTNKDRCVSFIVGDRPGKTNTSYLTDYMDYAPEADIGFPIKGRERLSLLLELFTIMIHEFNSSRFVVAITECSQIDEIKSLSLQNFENIIYEDFERCDAPPDCIYEVINLSPIS